MGLNLLNHFYLLGAVALLLFWAVGAYNRLVRLRAEALRTFGILSQWLQRRADHVLATAMEAPVPTVETSTSPANDDANPQASPVTPRPVSPWASAQGAATQFTASLAVARTKPLDAEAIAALSAAGSVLCMAWQRMAGECEALMEAPLPQALVWDDLSRQIHESTAHFTEAVDAYNAAVGQFPAQLLAWLVGFKQARALDMSLP